MKRVWILCLGIVFFLAGCTERPPEDTQPVRDLTRLSLSEQMRIRGFKMGSPVFIRIFKEESLLELWLQDNNGQYRLYQKFPICIYSGELGPKQQEGDRQSPEGFYQVRINQLNPHSNYHLSFNLGFPNTYDRAHGYTGSYLMVHGDCVSIGCYAMGDRQIEIIYVLVEEALVRGQAYVPVHIFPFRLTNAKLDQYRDHRWYFFWQMLKPGYDYFESYTRPPVIQVLDGRYNVDYILSAE